MIQDGSGSIRIGGVIGNKWLNKRENGGRNEKNKETALPWRRPGRICTFVDVS